MEVKSEMTGRAMGKHFTKQLHRDINENPIMKNSMVDIGTLMLSTFGKWLSLIPIVCHTANHTKDFVTAKTNWEEEKEPKE